jgi:putative oxidoreductase
MATKTNGGFYSLARFLISLIFIAAGFQKVFGPAQTAQYIDSVGLPQSMGLTWAAAAIELVGGFMILFGVQARVAAAVLAAYLVPVTLLFHTKFSDPMQIMNFLKNMAIMGGLVNVAIIERLAHARLRSVPSTTSNVPEQASENVTDLPRRTG